MTEDLREMRERIRSDVRSVLGQYIRLKRLLGGSSSVSLSEPIEMDGKPVAIGEARCWVLTLDIVVARVDRDVAQNACLAVAHRLVVGTKWETISDELFRPVESCKDIVAEATARLYAEFIVRGITDEYRRIEVAA